MDEGNVHQLWGFSPGLDLFAVRENVQHATTSGEEREASDVFRCLQVCPSDCRHTVTTLSRTSRHLRERGGPSSCEILVYEECIENLARHVLLVAVLLDDSLSVRERVETLLELHGNVFIQEKTESYLEGMGRRLEKFVSNHPGNAAEEKLCNVFDLSQLSYKDRDALVDVFHSYRSDGKYDMAKGWDSRLRNFYGDRFDFRKNMIDWDYHMRLSRRGCCGKVGEEGSIIHFHHFRQWRTSGTAYEFRDCVYNRPNRSLLTTAIGKSIFFKDRSLRDVGKTVSARGYWGDVANSPYHCFGAVCEDQSIFKKSNKQFMKTSVDVAEVNVQAMIDELQTGKPHFSQEKTQESPGVGESKASSSGAQQSNPGEHEKPSRSTATSQTPGEGEGQSAAQQQAPVQDALASPPPSSAPKEKENDGQNQNKDIVREDTQGNAIADREAVLNNAAWERCKHARVVLMTGDLQKKITGKKKFNSVFDVITIGCHNVHFAWEKWGLKNVANEGCICLIESVKYLLHLKEEQVEAFATKVSDSADGFDRLPGEFREVMDGALDAHLLFMVKR